MEFRYQSIKPEWGPNYAGGLGTIQGGWKNKQLTFLTQALEAKEIEQLHQFEQEGKQARNRLDESLNEQMNVGINEQIN